MDLQSNENPTGELLAGSAPCGYHALCDLFGGRRLASIEQDLVDTALQKLPTHLYNNGQGTGRHLERLDDFL